MLACISLYVYQDLVQFILVYIKLLQKMVTNIIKKIIRFKKLGPLTDENPSFSDSNCNAWFDLAATQIFRWGESPSFPLNPPRLCVWYPFQLRQKRLIVSNLIRGSRCSKGLGNLKNSWLSITKIIREKDCDVKIKESIWLTKKWTGINTGN